MSDGLCDRTEAAVAAVLMGAGTGAAPAAGGLPPELAAHARSCAACSDALLVGGLLARDAAELATLPGPPPAEAVWRRARARLDAEVLERATRPIAVFRKIAWAAGIVAWIGAMWRLAPAAIEWFRALRGLEWPGAEGLLDLPSGGLTGEPMLVAAAAAVLFAVFYGVWAVWAEEG